MKTSKLPKNQKSEKGGKSVICRHDVATENQKVSPAPFEVKESGADLSSLGTKRILISSGKDLMANVIRHFESYRTNKDGTSQVYLYVFINRERLRFQTGIFLKPNEWDEAKLLVKRTNKQYVDHNIEIRRIEAKITNIMVKLRLKDVKLTKDRLRLEYERPEFGFDFIDFMDRAIKERKNGDITDSTARQHKAIHSKLKAWRPFILSDELNEDLLLAYAKHMKTKLGNSQNSIHGNIKTIISYINRATDKGLIERGKPVRNPIKEVDGKLEFFSDQEYRALIELYRTKVLSDSLQSVLRWFLFSCSTGLRISDLRGITMENLYNDLLILIPKKTRGTTGKTVKIPLMKLAMELIQDEGPIHIDNKVFNCIAEQNMREYIKIIAREHCLMTKDFSWHASRHTFATVFLRNNPGDVVTLQKLMGLSNLKQAVHYTHIDTADVTKSMQFQNGY